MYFLDTIFYFFFVHVDSIDNNFIHFLIYLKYSNHTSMLCEKIRKRVKSGIPDLLNLMSGREFSYYNNPLYHQIANQSSWGSIPSDGRKSLWNSSLINYFLSRDWCSSKLHHTAFVHSKSPSWRCFLTKT